MAARIVNHLSPEDAGSLYGTVEEAETALTDMIKRFKAKGFTVTETDKNMDGDVWYSVNDEEGRPVGIFYIEP